jgi:hypothetical protein
MVRIDGGGDVEGAAGGWREVADSALIFVKRFV